MIGMLRWIGRVLPLIPFALAALIFGRVAMGVIYVMSWVRGSRAHSWLRLAIAEVALAMKAEMLHKIRHRHHVEGGALVEGAADDATEAERECEAVYDLEHCECWVGGQACCYCGRTYALEEVTK